MRFAKTEKFTWRIAAKNSPFFFRISKSSKINCYRILCCGRFLRFHFVENFHSKCGNVSNINLFLIFNFERFGKNVRCRGDWFNLLENCWFQMISHTMWNKLTLELWLRARTIDLNWREFFSFRLVCIYRIRDQKKLKNIPFSSFSSSSSLIESPLMKWLATKGSSRNLT